MAINRLYDTLVGATVNVNQLVDADTTSVTIQSGNKYYAVIGGTRTIANSTGTAISVTGGTDMLIDLTAYFGSSIADYLYNLESATAGAGIAKLKEWGFFTGDYIPYNPGTLESVEATAHKMVGFNQFDKSKATVGSFVDTDGTVKIDSACFATGFIRVAPNTNYYTNHIIGTGVHTCSYVEYDSNKNVVSWSSTGSGNDKTYSFTTGVSTSYIRVNVKVTYLDVTCINLSSDRNGEYEPYSAHTYDLGTDTLRGLFKLDSENRLYADGDTKTSDGTITRYYGTRAYQSGDESLADAITDGTTTVYKLTTPTTEQGDPFTNPQICDPDGTEEYVTSNGIPVGHETRYQL